MKFPKKFKLPEKFKLLDSRRFKLLEKKRSQELPASWPNPIHIKLMLLINLEAVYMCMIKAFVLSYAINSIFSILNKLKVHVNVSSSVLIIQEKYSSVLLFFLKSQGFGKK